MLFFIYLIKKVQLHAFRALCPTLTSPKKVSRHIDFHRVFDYVPGFVQVFAYTLQITIF